MLGTVLWRFGSSLYGVHAFGHAYVWVHMCMWRIFVHVCVFRLSLKAPLMSFCMCMYVVITLCRAQTMNTSMFWYTLSPAAEAQQMYQRSLAVSFVRLMRVCDVCILLTYQRLIKATSHARMSWRYMWLCMYIQVDIFRAYSVASFDFDSAYE